MGSSAPRTQTVTQQTSLPPWLESITQENLRRADEISNRPYEAYTGQLTAGFSPEQEAAFAYMQQGIGATNPYRDQALMTALGASQYAPQNVTAPTAVPVQQVNAGTVGSSAISARQVTPERIAAERIEAERIAAQAVAARDVAAQNFLQGDIQAYMNPYISNVEQAALSRLQGATQTAMNRLGDQAVSARAFGGSRQGIAEGIALGEAARSAGELSANLRSQGYNQAAAILQADQQRALQADLANQQANLAAGTTTAQLAQQAALANQQTGLQAGMANQQTGLQASMSNQQTGLQAGIANQRASLDAANASAQMALQAALANQQTGLQAALANQNANLSSGQFNAQQLMLAQQLNQQAGLQGANLRLSAANQMSGLADASQRGRQLDAALLENIGQQRQAMNQAALDEAYGRFLEQRNYPIEMLNLRLGATSATPYGTTTTGQQLVPRGNPFLTGLGGVGSAASGLASLYTAFGSDERMKTDIEKVGKDKDSGLTMYAYRYKGDPKSYPKVVGPMAQEIEKKYPDQVRDVGGRKAVNLGFGPMRKAMRDG